MKCLWVLHHAENNLVTTCVVVWIEIPTHVDISDEINVTTCVVVWIEISSRCKRLTETSSPPAWWCGLKLVFLFLENPLF